MSADDLGRAEPAGPPAGPQRVFVHIGPPKTGTTYLQSVLWSNRRRLRAAGVRLPVTGGEGAPHFEAAGDLRGRRRRSRARSGETDAWDRLSADVRGWPGVSVISCEWLAFCNDEQVHRAVTSFDGAAVHLLVTLRDLGRVVPAVWQEQVKNGKDFTMVQFLDKLARPHEDDYGRLFWSIHDTRQLLGRWGRDLPADRVHVVTLPRADSHPDELWHRFSSVFLPAGEGYDTSRARVNPGLEPAEAELLRRVNAELDGRMKKVAHGPLVKQYLHGELTRQEGSGARVRLTREALQTLADRAEAVKVELCAAGYPVVGSLDDLTVDTGAATASLPEDSATADVARAAVRSMAALLLTMQADGAHRRKVWRRAAAESAKAKGQVHGKGRSKRTGKGRTKAGRGRTRSARSLVRRLAGRVRRASTKG